MKKNTESKKALRLILGDQLNIAHSWYRTVDPSVTHLMMEVREEATYVTHHIQKVAGFFAAMREFARELTDRGHTVRYIRLDSPENLHSLVENTLAVAKELGATRIEYQLPDEYRVDQALKGLADKTKIAVAAVDTEHFFTTSDTVAELFKGKKTFLMESFYREMRRRHGILMDGENPVGDAWNFDHENRKPLRAGVIPPAAPHYHHDVSEIVALLKGAKVPTIGRITASDFRWPISRTEALASLEHFAAHCLPLFGEYQDAMHTEHRFLFHSLLSFPLNIKLISPAEVIERCIAEWRARPDEISLPQIEGFVRQILGWREYMRGLYWAKMPEYAALNFFGASTPLPKWYWTGETKMRCLSAAITQSLDEAYAHHIQRLMVTGNFAMIAGINPDEVDRWYLGVYIDALEWVEITNTRGMSQFADGGIIATKPYAASANYIGKMSNYCAKCSYDSKKRIGDNACPFNSLYWDFFDRNRALLAKNPRIGMAYRNLDKMAKEDLVQIRSQAKQYRDQIDSL